MSRTWKKTAFFVGVQTRSPVQILLLPSIFRWAFGRANDLHYGLILYGSIGFWVLFNFVEYHFLKICLQLQVPAQSFRVGRAANLLKNLPRVQLFLLASFFLSSPKISQDVLIFFMILEVEFMKSFLNFFSLVSGFLLQSPTLTELTKNSKFWHSSFFHT